MEMKKTLIIAILVILVIVLITGFYFAMGSNEKTNLTITSDKNLTDGDVFSVKLTNENGSGIANKTINVNLTDSNNNTTSVNITTDYGGNGNFTINLDADNYSVNVCFAGDENYAPSSSMQHLTIAEVISETSTQKSTSTSTTKSTSQYSTSNKASDESASSEDDDVVYSTDPNSDKCVLDENGHIDQSKVDYYTKIAQEKYGPIG